MSLKTGGSIFIFSSPSGAGKTTLVKLVSKKKNFITSISGAATAISNVGPGLGEIIGPNGSFKDIPIFSKWVLSIGMLLGRLEIFALLVLFFPNFWRN